MRRELRCYDYVNKPYTVVRDALKRDLIGIFERAARGPELHARIGRISLGVPITIRVLSVGEIERYGQDATRFELEWQATDRPKLFPTMRADLDVYALGAGETQLDLHGVYDPPLGIVGDAGDALAAHAIAEAAVRRFVEEVGGYLRDRLAAAEPITPRSAADLGDLRDRR
jgi:hypothetical protein